MDFRVEVGKKSLEGSSRVKFDHSIRKVESEGLVDWDLFPYKIKDRPKFLHQDHPVQIHPNSFRYQEYWSDFYNKSIDGIWVDDGGTWVYMMPKLFFYINYMRIVGNAKGDGGEKDRKVISPDLSSLEWFSFSYIFCADGFSGFEDDDNYTCNRLVEQLYNGVNINKFEREKLKRNCYKPNGKLKTFVDPWEYLTRFYLIDNPSKQPLGKPLYENRRQNACLTGSRAVAKSYITYGGDLMYEWTFAGTRTSEDKSNLGVRNLFAVGCGSKLPLNRSLAIVSSFYDNQPGKYRFPNPDQQDCMGPFYRNTTGNWEAGSEVNHVVRNKSGRTDAIRTNSLQAAVFTPDKKRIGAGDRFKRIYIEEAGLIEYLPDIHATNKDSMEVDADKTGSAFYTGTAGELKAVEGIKKIVLNPRGYQVVPIPNYWKNPDSEIGLFLSAMYRYRGYSDDNGNNDLKVSLAKIALDRMKGLEEKDSSAYQDDILNAPINPDEMLRPNRKAFLPVSEAQERIGIIEDWGLMDLKSTTGVFKFNNNETYGVEFIKDSKLSPITKFHIDRAKINIEGAPIIYEHPNGYIPDNLYWVIFDPVAKPGKGQTMDASLNSVIVYKWFYTGDENTMEDNIVAEWVGRHDQLSDTYELVIKMAKYFNAMVFPETNTPGFVDWCKGNNYAHMLQESAHVTERLISPNYSTMRGKVGFSMYGDKKKPWLVQRLKSWLLRKRGLNKDTGDFEDFTINKIMSTRLLEEITAFDINNGNYDHISSMLGLMLLITQFEEDPPDILPQEYKKRLQDPSTLHIEKKPRRKRCILEQMMYD